MKLRILACSLLAVLASCASSSSNLSLDERVAEAAEHEFEMEMTGVEKVDAILTASSIVLEVYKTNLVAERARNSVAAVSSFDGKVNNELTAAGIEPDEATDDQKKEFAKKVWDAMTPEEQQALETQGQAWSAVSDALVKSLKSALVAKGARMFTAEALQEIVTDDSLREQLGNFVTAAQILRNLKAHAGAALDNITLKADIDRSAALAAAAAGDK